MSRKVSTSQMADSLQWLSFALILVFVAQVITALFPIALLQPEWMVRVSGALRETASLPLMALALIMLANMFDAKLMPSQHYLGLFRRIATLAAIGFLLLIPLQTYGTVGGIRTQFKQGQAQLAGFISAGKLVQSASNEQQLRDAIRTIPGAEELANRPLGADVQTIKTSLLDRLRESTNRLQNQLKAARSKAIQDTIPLLIRDAVIALGFAIGFAGMGYSKTGQPTLLRRLVKARNPQLSKGQEESTVATVNTPRRRRAPRWMPPWLRFRPGKFLARWLKKIGLRL